ncbi:MAG: methyltransferase domain-containing protein [Bacteroidota bacterium]
MNFQYKCVLQHLFSLLPRGARLQYGWQRYISKSLPPDKTEFLHKVAQAYQHAQHFQNYHQLKNPRQKYYEFGAGWTLIIPLAMRLLGFEVFCGDLRKLIFPSLIQDSWQKFHAYQSDLPFSYDPKFSKPLPPKNLIKHLSQAHQVHYRAPSDARNTGFKNNYFDLISSTVTLEHVPKQDILPIFQECHRILQKGGILSLVIDYQDHWAYFDPSISIYNFLRYSPTQWKWYNPSLHYQNRLRHSDYLNLISQTDFKLVYAAPWQASLEDKQALAALPRANMYQDYDLDDLSIKGSEIVLRK